MWFLIIQSEASGPHMLRFKLANQSTSVYDIILRHTSCQLLIGWNPHDSKLQSSNSSFTTALNGRFVLTERSSNLNSINI